MPRLKAPVGALLVLLAAGGCGGGPKYVPVSGVVTMDGVPYPNAIVSFQPIGGKGNQDPGEGSMGVTDASGRFVLLYGKAGKDKGAVVGTHRVRISTKPGKGSVDDPNGSPDGVVLPKGAKPDMDYDPIPLEWNEHSEKTFEVTAEGTDQANFAIVTKKGAAKKDGKK